MKPNLDLPLIIATSIILGLGALIHYSISPTNFPYHLLFLLIGLLIAWVILKLDLRLVSQFSLHLFLLGNLLLVLTLIVGATTRGSTRWLDFGLFRFQPSELIKPALILFLAHQLSKARLDTLSSGFKQSLLIFLPITLIFLQPDLGTALILLLISAGMFFAAGLRYRHLFLYLFILLLSLPPLWLTLKDYQQNRILTFLNPTADPLGKGYNSIQSMIAVGSGQVLGRGLGHGTQSQLNFLPEHQTDFAFASLAEELGLLGSLILLAAYTWLLFRLLSLAQHTSDQFAFLALVGISSLFAIQIFVNIGMNIGLLPVTGITLPLVSSGGTSIITSLAALGLALNLARFSSSRSTIEIT